MKTQLKRNVIKKLLMLFVVCSLFTACFADDEIIIPEVTITVTNCDVADIVMNPEVTIGGTVGRWTINVSVTITCQGEAVEDAEIKVKYSGFPIPRVIKTDSTGTATGRVFYRYSARPSGTVQVTIQGNDDSITQTVSF